MSHYYAYACYACNQSTSGRCPQHAVNITDYGLQNSDIEWLRADVSRLQELLLWVRQTVHRAHHSGPIETCPKNTCEAIHKGLGKVEITRR